MLKLINEILKTNNLEFIKQSTRAYLLLIVNHDVNIVITIITLSVIEPHVQILQGVMYF